MLARRVVLLLGVCVACNSASEPDASVDAAEQSDACLAFCMGNEAALLQLPCAHAGVVDASATGVCGPFTCPISTGGVPFVDCDMVLVFADAAGPCDVSVQFEGGAAYGATIDFSAGLTSSCCPQIFAPKPAVLYVDAGCSEE